MRNIAVLVSGGGTNLQALIDAQAAGKIPDGRIVRVIASREGVYALERARQHNIPSVVVARRQFADQQAFDAYFLSAVSSVPPFSAGNLRRMDHRFFHSQLSVYSDSGISM